MDEGWVWWVGGGCTAELARSVGSNLRHVRTLRELHVHMLRLAGRRVASGKITSRYMACHCPCPNDPSFTPCNTPIMSSA